MTVAGNVLTGSRALGLVGEFAGHVMTGSAVGRGLAALPGHVITGAGHFIEIAGYTVQEVPVVASRVNDAFDRAQQVANRLQAPMAWPMQIPTNAPRDFTLAPAMEQRGIVLASDVESRAWENRQTINFNHEIRALKEIALSLGSAMSGNMEGALEHGMTAVLEMVAGNRELHDIQRDIINAQERGASHRN